MPNWITNRVTVTGRSDDINALKQHLYFDDEGELVFDFETIVPIPAVVQATAETAAPNIGLVALGSELAAKTCYGRMTLDRVMKSGWAREADIKSRAGLLTYMRSHRPEELAAARKVIRCHRLTGFVDWEAWLAKRWGTKRDAIDAFIQELEDERLAFVFSSASDMPEPIYRMLGRMHPALRFDICAIDPGSPWACRGEVRGKKAAFRLDDPVGVYEEMFGCPPDGFDEDLDAVPL